MIYMESIHFAAPRRREEAAIGRKHAGRRGSEGEETSRYLALVRFDPRDRAFEVRSPDFPQLGERCTEIDEVPEVASAAVRAELVKLERDGKPLPPPVPKTAVHTNPEFSRRFLLLLEAC